VIYLGVQTITIHTNAEDQTIPVSSFSIDQSMAMHEGSDGWTITHVKTGLSMIVNIINKNDAENVMHRLMVELGPMIRRTVRAERHTSPTPSAIRLRDAMREIALSVPMRYIPHYWS